MVEEDFDISEKIDDVLSLKTFTTTID